MFIGDLKLSFFFRFCIFTTRTKKYIKGLNYGALGRGVGVRPHLNYLNTTTGSLFKIKFYVLPFGQRFKFYTSKLAGVEEIVFSVLSLYKPKSTICA
jgi:hypothetical protein